MPGPLLAILGGHAMSPLLMSLCGAAVRDLRAERFDIGGAVNNAEHTLGNVLGTALAVVLVGTPPAGHDAVRGVVLRLAALGAATALLGFGLPRGGARA